MSRLRQWWHRVRAVGRPGPLDRDFDAERAAHLQIAADEYERRGLTKDEAMRRAKIDFGAGSQVTDVVRDARGLPVLESLWRDLRYASRSLRRDTGAAAAAALILAVGIGASTAVFSVVRPILIAPLPFPAAGDLVWVANDMEPGLSGATFWVSTYEMLRDRTPAFRDWTGYFGFSGFGNNTLTGRGDPERVFTIGIAPRFFELLGVAPALGRLFTADEQRSNGPAAVLVSHDYWRRRLGASPDIAGTYVTINDRPRVVAGVMPEWFDFASIFAPGTRADFFEPAVLDDMRTWGNVLTAIARLAPGASLERARAEADAVAATLAQERPDLPRFSPRISRLQDHVSGSLQRPLGVLWAAVGLVLLVVCANVTNLVLARSTGRRREFAVRAALGASRRRLFQQLTIEGALLAGVGAVLGVPVAYGLTAWFRSYDTLAIPLLSRATVDGGALAATAALGVVIGLTVSALPAAGLSHADPQAELKDHTRGSIGGRRQAWMRSSLAVLEIALACVLLVGAGLLLRSFVRLVDTDLGFRPAHSTVLRLRLGGTRTRAQAVSLLTEAARRVDDLAAVDAAGLTDALPLDRNRSWSIGVPGVTYPNRQRPNAFVYITGPGYVRAMGMSLLAGRDFATTDTADAPPVLLVSASLARQLYPDQDPVGEPAQFRPNVSYMIIGVVADVRQTSLDERGATQMYLTFAQGGALPSDLVVRSAAPGSIVAPVRQALADLDPTLLVTDARPAADLVERSASPRRFLVSVVGGFSLFALLLASLGIYSVVSYGVSQRGREIGVRMALGATAGDVLRQVLRETAALGAAGLAAGLLLALALSRFIDSLLFETSPADLATLAGTVSLLFAVTAAAGFLPALRASRIAPGRALDR